ncbi:hypothetical protein DPEC_G00326110 [Dallia pectoralis]|uniref:Uncharacterized protein n=1 Tax=Dallia pectoralis TaxID=75939 RepID=A0ACC2F7V2_DALPE|nr:hypothetical protein DPEC_G00326110 [Dallia pectoralis]
MALSVRKSPAPWFVETDSISLRHNYTKVLLTMATVMARSRSRQAFFQSDLQCDSLIGQMNTSTGNASVPNSNLTDTNMARFYLLGAVHIVNLLLGFPSNCCVVWVITTGGIVKITSEFLSLNLSMSDIIYSLSTGCLMIIYAVQPDKPMFTAISFFIGLIVTCRSLFHCCISVECYLAVLRPVLFLEFKPLKYRAACSAAVWALGLGSCCVCMNVDINSRVFFYYLIGQCTFYFGLVLFTSVSVLRALKRPGPGEGGAGGGRDKGRRSREAKGKDGTNNPMKRKAFNTVMVTVTTIVGTYIPLWIMAPFILYVTIDLPFAMCYSFAIVCGLVKPFMYLHRAGKLPRIPVFTGNDKRSG